MKIRLEPLGSNRTLLHINDGLEILFSYSTPVAGFSRTHGGYFKTTTFWSRTTSRHINQYLDGAEAKELRQEEISAMINTRLPGNGGAE
jgi:hypothetical protein